MPLPFWSWILLCENFSLTFLTQKCFDWQELKTFKSLESEWSESDFFANRFEKKCIDLKDGTIFSSFQQDSQLKNSTGSLRKIKILLKPAAFLEPRKGRLSLLSPLTQLGSSCNPTIPGQINFSAAARLSRNLWPLNWLHWPLLVSKLLKN